ncbi:hypothetical protein ABK040_009396 [Willaertia magna]
MKRKFKTYEGTYPLDFCLSKHVNLEDHHKKNYELKSRFLLQNCCIGIAEVFTTNNLKLSQSSTTTSSSNINNNNEKVINKPTPLIYVSCSTQKHVYVWCLNQLLKDNKENEKAITDLASKGGLTTCSSFHVYMNEESNRKNSLKSSDNYIYELLIGFNTGDIAIHNIKMKKTDMFNKDYTTVPSPVTCGVWLDSDIFCVGYKSGTIVFCNKNWKIEESLQRNMILFNENVDNISTKTYYLHYINSNEENSNPIRKLQFGSGCINDISISPNRMYLCVVTSTGKCHIVNMKTWKIIITFISYYGGFNCCSWSPDSKYLVVGGEDDLIHVFDINRKCILGRGVGHSAFVSKVIFDYYECDNEKYRIISVGEDTKLILWDIDRNDSHLENDGMDIQSTIEQKLNAKEEGEIFIEIDNDDNDIYTFEPIAIHKAHSEPIRDVKTFSSGIVTVCNQGILNFWARPNNNEVLGFTNNSQDNDESSHYYESNK